MRAAGAGSNVAATGAFAVTVSGVQVGSIEKIGGGSTNAIYTVRKIPSTVNIPFNPLYPGTLQPTHARTRTHAHKRKRTRTHTRTPCAEDVHTHGSTNLCTCRRMLTGAFVPVSSGGNVW